MKQQPPRLAQRLLLAFLRPDLADEVLGDLEEGFKKTAAKSAFRAKLDYWIQVLNYLRPFAVGRKRSTQTVRLDMLFTYITIARRTFVRHKLYSFIKVGSLMVGVAACALIAVYLSQELGYDRQYPKNIYRLVGATNQDGEVMRGTSFPAPMASALKNDFPEVLQAGRFNASELFGMGACEVRPADRMENGHDEGFSYVDAEFVSMLQLPFIYGSAENALKNPRTVVLTQRKAEKYFPGIDPVGKLLVVNNDDKKPYTIGGVVEDFHNTHLAFDFLITMTGVELWKGEQNEWGASNYSTYVAVAEGTDIKALEKRMTHGVLEKYFLPMVLRDGMPYADAKKMMDNAWVELQPISRIHLYSSSIRDGIVQGDIRLVWLFAGIGLFILILAAINFINLSTARSANRAKEVGMRKVSGSLRGHLLTQFLTESVVYSFLGFALGIVLAAALLPWFSELAGRSLSIPWGDWRVYPVVLAMALLTGILAGVYPAVYLSSFQPIEVLKGHLVQGSRGSGLRGVLVVFQFATSVILIVGTLTINRQMNFILETKVGFDKSQVMLIEGTGNLGQRIEAFRNEVTALPMVEQASVGDYLPVKGMKRNGNSFWHEGKVQQERPVIAQKWKVDPFYLATLGMTLKEGRNFDPSRASDSSAVLINETMVYEMGGEEILGKKISNGGDLLTVIGVVNDFHFETLRSKIEPLCLVLGQSPTVVAVRIRPGSASNAIEEVEKTWRSLAPQQPFRYSFLDDRFTAMYADVQRTGRLVTSFSVLAISVACLGLFGLSAFLIEQRSKEIGIRLVLGASVPSVFSLLTSNFLKLVGVGIVAATPVAWYLMDQWLKEFAYRVEPDALTFLLAGIAAVSIALVTIGRQAWRAGKVSPVSSLKQA